MKRIWLLLALLLLWTNLAGAWQKPPAGTLIKPGHPDAQGLAGYWLLNEGAGDTAFDLSGNGNNGTLYGPTWVPGKDGWTLDLDGSDDYITKDSPSFINAQSGSMSFWYRNEDTGVSIIVSVSVAGSNDDEIHLYADGANERVSYALRVNGTTQLLTRGEVGECTNNTWCFVFFTSDGSIVKHYINGIEQTLTDGIGTNAGQWFGDAVDADNFTVGGVRRATLDSSFQGMVGGIKIYNRVLSAAEVKQSYISPYTMLQQQQVWQWFVPAAGAARRIFFAH